MRSAYKDEIMTRGLKTQATPPSGHANMSALLKSSGTGPLACARVSVFGDSLFGVDGDADGFFEGGQAGADFGQGVVAEHDCALGFRVTLHVFYRGA